MSIGDWIQILAFVGPLLIFSPLLGSYIANVFSEDRRHFPTAVSSIENGIYRICGVDRSSEMDWTRYAWGIILFNVLGFLAVFLLQIFQSMLPLNTEHLRNVRWDLAFNTAASFMTNTNWQSYSGEETMSYLTQMLGLTVQNFLSAATGIAVFLALARGIVRKSTLSLGNCWVDITRATIYVLLPLSVILAAALSSQGVIQNFSSYVHARTLEGGAQILPMGPVASQVAIKQLGTNGGGFFGANSAHPFENPTPFSNWLEMFAILLIPAALTFTYGAMVKSRRQGWNLFAAMFIIWAVGLGLSLYGEYSVNPVFGVGGLMEGKEARFGVINSIIWSVSTTAASNGSVSALHSSLSPIAGGIALFNIMLGEIVFGGVGSGLYGMLLFVLMTVFLSGLMVGRTPEYLGKKIETREIAMVLIAILVPSAAILLGSGATSVMPAKMSGILNQGPHGLTEILYAFSSASQNNGSAFAGLATDTPFYNLSLGICMMIGRFAVIVPVLAVAGSLARKNAAPPSEGTFSTDNSIFLILLIAVIVIVGALTFLPALALGPLAEHILMLWRTVF